MTSATPPVDDPAEPVFDSDPRHRVQLPGGSFASVRHALLRSPAGPAAETFLSNWRPPSDDLGLQLLEWWAYLADILYFYDQQIALDSYWATARPYSAANLLSLLGQDRLNAVAAHGVVAAMTRSPARPASGSPTKTRLAAGVVLTSTPNDAPPVIFETQSPVTLWTPSALNVRCVDPHLFRPGSQPDEIGQPHDVMSVLLLGTASTVSPGSPALIVALDDELRPDPSRRPACLPVLAVEQEPDPDGGFNTRLTFDNGGTKAAPGNETGIEVLLPSPVPPPAESKPEQNAPSNQDPAEVLTGTWEAETKTTAQRILANPVTVEVPTSAASPDRAAAAAAATGNYQVSTGGTVARPWTFSRDPALQWTADRPTGVSPLMVFGAIALGLLLLSFAVWHNHYPDVVIPPHGRHRAVLFSWTVALSIAITLATCIAVLSLIILVERNIERKEAQAAAEAKAKQLPADGPKLVLASLALATLVRTVVPGDLVLLFRPAPTAGDPTAPAPAVSTPAGFGAALDDPILTSTWTYLAWVVAASDSPSAPGATPTTSTLQRVRSRFQKWWSQLEADENRSPQIKKLVAAIAKVFKPLIDLIGKTVSGLRRTGQRFARLLTGPGSQVTPAVPHTTLALAIIAGDSDPKQALAKASSRDAPVPSGQDLQVIHSWRPVGVLAQTPVTELIRPSSAEHPVLGAPALLEDTNGDGWEVWVDFAGIPSPTDKITVHLSEELSGPGTAGSWPERLVPPVQLLLNPVPILGGRTVTAELLGTGDAANPQQSFTLSHQPLTGTPAYLPTDPPLSTLRVEVEDIVWPEATTVAEGETTARTYRARTDADGTTTVGFGDGVGSRLPTGAEVTASYRYGGGAVDLPAGATFTILQPQPGLAGLRSPLPIKGGAEQEAPTKNPPAKAQPPSTLISVDDLMTLIRSQPEVASAALDGTGEAPDSKSGASRPTIWVAPRASVPPAQLLPDLLRSGFPSTDARLQLAAARQVTVSATVALSANADADEVSRRARQSVADLIGSLGVGERLYGSAVENALRVTGVRSVLDVRLDNTADSWLSSEGGSPQEYVTLVHDTDLADVVKIQISTDSATG